MAKKGERVGNIGDSVYYRTPDGQIIDDQGNVIKGQAAKMMADEYESKQQEKAKAQAEAKAAAEEAKRQAAAAKSAEIARKAAEREATARQRQEQQEAKRQEAQAAAETRRQQAEANRQRTANVKQSAPPKQQQAPAAPSTGPSAGDQIKGAFKSAAMNVGRTAFDSAFPTISKAINYPNDRQSSTSSSDVTDGSARQSLNRVADEVNTTNMMMQTSIARQEMTNQLLGSILKEIQQVKKPSLLDTAADALGSLGGGAKTAGKVAPKSGMLGAAGSALKRAPIIGALLGGGISGYEEYQESGNAGRAVSTGVGGAAGGGLGAWGGASAGAALGAFGGPVGMAIGGLLGAIGGGLGGSYLGSKAGKGAYDMLSSGPGASADIKEAQAKKIENNVTTPTDSVVNIKTLTFNAEHIVFNSKDNQNLKATPTSAAVGDNAGSAAPAADASKASTGSSLPLPGASGGQGISKVLETKPGSNTVELADGSVEKRTGSRNWRNNNPGNIEYGALAKSNGAIALSKNSIPLEFKNTALNSSEKSSKESLFIVFPISNI
jgi:chemotaxis protein histidine kinase CheA